MRSDLCRTFFYLYSDFRIRIKCWNIDSCIISYLKHSSDILYYGTPKYAKRICDMILV